DHKQWLLGKSMDTHAPMGPWAVTADEVGDLAALEVSSTVNGEPRQKAPVADLIFDVPELIRTISAGITLLPGDIIATGTPAGVVGHSMAPITVRLLAATRPELVSHLALLGAVPAPLPEAGQQGQHDRAAKARAGEMPAIADAVMANATAEATRRDHPATAA